MTQASSNYERVDGEKYFTPLWVTDALLEVELFDGRVCDPAAGAGHIVEACIRRGLEAYGFDLAPDSPDIMGPLDFLKTDGNLGSVITNPPYGIGSRLAVKFVEHALALTKARRGKVAMLLKVGFDSAKGRTHLFANHPAFAVEYRLLQRIRWANLKQSAAGPTENHSWFVWDWKRQPGPAVKGYLPSNEATHA